jgi:hypothetical protein
MADFGIQYPREYQLWHSTSNYLTCLSVKDEQSLQALAHKLTAQDVKHITFRESDLEDQITAIAIEPSDAARRLCSSFPLALKTHGTLNKHTIKETSNHEKL